jgi:hypothetical protein
MRKQFAGLIALLIVLVLGPSVSLAQNQVHNGESPYVYKATDQPAVCGRRRGARLGELGIKIIDGLRGRIETCTDDKAKLGFRPDQDTTIEHLVSLRRPRLIFLRFGRVRPVEFTIYSLQVTLEAYRLQMDGDYHLILRGESGQTMIAEIRDPESVARSSRFRNEIAEARKDFADIFHPTRRWQTSDTPIKITGIGFWDFPHFQRGAARNSIEIHPVLAIKTAL